MNDLDVKLARSPLCDGLGPGGAARMAAIADRQELRAGEYLFLLGEPADRLFVLLHGRLEVCLPLCCEGGTRDVAVETLMPGDALGWSTFVEPYRFTLSARAAEPSSVAVLPRQELWRVLDGDPVLGYAFTRRVAELIGRRLLTLQALWARDLQRSLTRGLAAGEGRPW